MWTCEEIAALLDSAPQFSLVRSRKPVKPVTILRSLAYLANAAYVVALVVAAINIYAAGHREPSGPLADWAAIDAWFSTVVAGGAVLYALVHAIAVLLWWRLGQIGPLLLTTLPLAGLLLVVWVAYERTDVPGWQLVVVGLLAAATSYASRRRIARGW